jgi:hypothetical protein
MPLGAPLLERTVSLKIEEAHTKLEASFVLNGCKVAAEESPKRLCLRQGSLWGLSPKSAKKTIVIQLEQQGDQTYIQCSSVLASDWKNITLIGCILAAVLAVVCVWMAYDLSRVLVTAHGSFWSWLITVDGKVNSEVGGVFVRLVWGLAGFLSAVIALEAVILVYARLKIDAFAAGVLVAMS